MTLVSHSYFSLNLQSDEIAITKYNVYIYNLFQQYICSFEKFSENKYVLFLKVIILTFQNGIF